MSFLGVTGTIGAGRGRCRGRGCLGGFVYGWKELGTFGLDDDVGGYIKAYRNEENCLRYTS